MLQPLTHSPWDVERWALDVSEFDEFQQRPRSVDRRSRLHREPGFKRATLAHAAQIGAGKFVRMSPVCCVKFLIAANPELLSAANGIDAGKGQEIDHTKALRNPIVGGQRW